METKEVQQIKGMRNEGGHFSILNMVVRVGLFQKRWHLGVDSHTDISGESVTGTKNSECKSPKLIKCLRPIPESKEMDQAQTEGGKEQ